MSRMAWTVGLVLVLDVGVSPRAVAQVAATVQRELTLLESRDAAERANAAARLGTMGMKAHPAIPKLVRLLDDSAELIDWSGKGRSTVEKVALDALRQLGRPARTELLRVAALEPWTIHSNDPTTEVWTLIASAIDALGALREARAVPLLASILLQPEPEGDRSLRSIWVGKPMHAANAIATIQGPDAFDVLQSAFRLKRTDDAYLLTWRLAEKLAETGGPRAIDPLLEWLTQAQLQPDVRDPVEVEEVIKVLGQLKDRRSVDGLCAALESGKLTALKRGPNVYDMTDRLLGAISALTGLSFKDKASALQWWKGR